MGYSSESSKSSVALPDTGLIAGRGVGLTTSGEANWLGMGVGSGVDVEVSTGVANTT